MENRKTVLVVDDTSVNLQFCKGILGSKYDVRLAKSGKTALSALERIQPDVILLDIEMPDMTGFEFMEEMKKNADLSSIPVIFVTSHATEKLVEKALGLGAVDYVVKPFLPDILLAKVKNALSAVV
ncbi:MAG: response regulator [Clostridiales bacterium]|nr:response regulator [Clostridiales bacterium]